MSDPLNDLRQLDEFHQQLSRREGPLQAALLRNGPLPDTTEVLMEAGIRCIPLIEGPEPDVTDAALDRLTAVCFKLKVSPEADGSREVLEQLGAVIEKYKRKEVSDTRLGCALITGLVALITGLILLIIYFVTR
jgi:hypothetical protein